MTPRDVGFGCLALAFCGAMLQGVTRSSDPVLCFLDVGQGDAIVLRDGRRTLLIDAGGSDPFFNAGERRVAPRLRELGVDRIDLWVLTHPDRDHIGGFTAARRHRRIGRIITHAAFRYRPEMQPVLESGADVVWGSERTEIRWDNFTIWLHFPPSDQFEADNDRSVVVELESRGARALLTGDLGSVAEPWLISQGVSPVQVLKAGHHGSFGSTSPELLAAMQPEWVVISAGRRNLYRHPHPAVLDRAEAAGAKVARTDRKGPVCFRPQNGRFRLTPWPGIR